MAPRIRNLVTGWKLVVSVTARRLCSRGKNSLYPLDRRLGGPQSRFGRGGEERKIPPLPLPGNELLSSRILASN